MPHTPQPASERVCLVHALGMGRCEVDIQPGAPTVSWGRLTYWRSTERDQAGRALFYPKEPSPAAH